MAINHKVWKKESKKDDEDTMMECAGGALSYKVTGKTTLKKRHSSRDLKEVKVELFQTDITGIGTIIRPTLQIRNGNQDCGTGY